ncbi:MAG: phosphomannomutase/phosphoglucomutase [Candidatus Moranbacteria bacterium]|nr:phosphomannomutase/phosphoglucomutase [Candidatus Moranbacteria bacterium]
MEKGIFKAYDIRGLYPAELNEDGAYAIGRALVAHTGAKKVAVGMDMRESSPSLKNALLSGITEQGADVVDIGIVSTPMVYFASWNLDVDAAVMVTASHNPAEYNGMKFCLKGAVPIGEGNGMEEIRDMAVAGGFPEAVRRGEVEENETLKEDYVDYVAGFFKPGVSKKKIVIDFANGMGIADKDVYSRFQNDIEAVSLFDELDGNFPNHEANPLKTETLGALQAEVIANGADLGIAYDGDADRVGFVDEKGDIVPMDFMIALLAKEVLKKYPGGKILMDLRSSNAVKEVIEEAGGSVERSRVGHSLIKKQMREVGAVFAGELSGHYFFEENSKAEMATLAAMMLLNLMNETGKKMSELTAELKRYFHSGEINSDVADKDAVMAKLKEIYKDGKLDERDGIRIDFPEWWFNVRASNTEPKLRLNLEANTKEMMEEKRDEVLGVIRG